MCEDGQEDRCRITELALLEGVEVIFAGTTPSFSNIVLSLCNYSLFDPCKSSAY